MPGQSCHPDFVGVVVAAGSATRFGDPVPKQFRDLGARSVLRRSVDALARQRDVRGVVVVLAPAEVDGPRGGEVRGWPGVLAVVPGGATRRQSVRRGLASLADGAVDHEAPYVLVHDAARPLAGARLILDVIEATRRHGAAIPGLAVTDTVKQVDAEGYVLRTVERGTLRLAQTPQGARRDWLVEALDRAEPGDAATDEGAALEAAGRKVAIVPGDPANRKITTPDDLDQARRLLAGDVRCGTGFDVHRLGADRDLLLGGVRFEGEPGLIGHSDADVVLHAAMDAVLGAAALGDIGHFFPPADPQFKDADSAGLSRQVAARLRDHGFEIVNLDLTVLAERPKIGPRRDEMRRVIGECFGVDPERVGVKATTLEGLGALGRGEGIACQASATIREVAE